MSSPSKTEIDDAIKLSMFTKEGLPLDHTYFGTALTTADACDGGPFRRIDCQPPQSQIISAPSIRSSKIPSSETSQESSLLVGPVHGTLIDDDDDELMDYFDMNGGGFAPLTSLSPATDGVHSSSRWDVREHNVNTLPSFYPLEKSAVFISHTSAPILANRITAVLQARSITASFDAQNAKVDCVSKSHVEFRIRLYRGREEYKHGIIVEVQRRAGFDLRYTQDVYAILDAAEGKIAENVGGKMTPIYYEEIERGVSRVEESMDSLENQGEFALQIISDILCPPNGKAEEVTVEGRHFAMASLASLTSLEHMGQAAVHISNELLFSEAHAELGRVVFSNVALSQNHQCLVIQSLEILANVANSSQTPAQLLDLISQNDSAILIKLIANIENAPLNPRVADLSCLILNNICSSHENMLSMMKLDSRETLISGLVKAVSYGEECYAELERHSQECLQLIL